MKTDEVNPNMKYEQPQAAKHSSKIGFLPRKSLMLP